MGIGNNKQSKWKTVEPQERSAMVQQEIRDMEEESRKTKAVQMGKHCHGQGGQPLNGHCHGQTSGHISH